MTNIFDDKIQSMTEHEILTKLFNILYRNKDNELKWLDAIIKHNPNLHDMYFTLSYPNIRFDCINPYHAVIVGTTKSVDNKIECLNKLFATDCNINEIDNDGFTPLLYACKFNSDFQIVKLLLNHGANPTKINKVNKLEESTLSYAIKFRRADLVELLLNRGADEIFFNKNKAKKYILRLSKYMGTLKISKLIDEANKLSKCKYSLQKI